MKPNIEPSVVIWIILFALLLPADPANRALGFVDFTPEELSMNCPEWCAGADALVLLKVTSYKLFEYEELEGLVQRRGLGSYWQSFHSYDAIFSETRWAISSTHTLRIKILTERGKDYGRLQLDIPPGHLLDDTFIEGRTISPQGKVTSLSQKGIFKKTVPTDWKQFRQVVVEVAFPNVVPGSIIEIQYDTYSPQALYIPPHYFDHESLPTQTSLVAFTTPKQSEFLAHPVNAAEFGYDYSIEQVSGRLEKETRFSAVVSQVAIDRKEKFLPGDGYVRPHIYFSIASVSYITGSHDICRDWQSASKSVERSFFRSYLEDKKPVRKLFERLVPDQTSRDLLAVALYNWVTDSLETVDSRYWFDLQREPAEVIKGRKGTGIEKVLTLKSLYDIAGFNAQVILVPTTDQGPIVETIPALGQFSSAILRLVDNTTVDLDPSSGFNSFGRIPWNLQGGWGLPITDTTQVLTQIQVSAGQNVCESDIVGRLDSSRHFVGECRLTLTGEYYVKYRVELSSEDSQARKTVVCQQLLPDLDTSQVKEIRLDRTDHVNGLLKLFLSIQIENASTIDGEDMLFSPNLFSRIPANWLPDDDFRESDLDFGFPQVQSLSLSVSCPGGFRLEGDPLTLEASATSELTYSASLNTSVSGDSVIYSRVLDRKHSLFSAEGYETLREYFNAIARHDRIATLLSRRDQDDSRTER